MLELESEILNRTNQRIAKSFLDVLILLELRKQALNDYDITTRMRNKFHITLEQESVCSTLIFLESNGLVKSGGNQQKRMYAITEKGEKRVKTVLNMRDKILGLVLNILTG